MLFQLSSYLLEEYVPILGGSIYFSSCIGNDSICTVTGTLLNTILLLLPLNRPFSRRPLPTCQILTICIPSQFTHTKNKEVKSTVQQICWFLPCSKCMLATLWGSRWTKLFLYSNWVNLTHYPSTQIKLYSQWLLIYMWYHGTDLTWISAAAKWDSNYWCRSFLKQVGTFGFMKEESWVLTFIVLWSLKVTWHSLPCNSFPAYLPKMFAIETLLVSHYFD